MVSVERRVEDPPTLRDEAENFLYALMEDDVEVSAHDAIEDIGDVLGISGSVVRNAIWHMKGTGLIDISGENLRLHEVQE